MGTSTPSPVPASLSVDCPQTSFSHKRNRLYCRKFNWEDARRRHAAGETMAAIARSLGVSKRAIRIAVDDEFRRLDHAKALAWLRGGACPDCGKQTTRHNKSDSRRCRDCASALLRSSVSLDVSGNLVAIHCFGCDRWLTEEAFSPSRWKISLRGVGARICRSCESARRRDYRHRHRIPCENCGQPRMPDQRNNDSGLCRSCYVEMLRRPAEARTLGEDRERDLEPAALADQAG